MSLSLYHISTANFLISILVRILIDSHSVVGQIIALFRKCRTYVDCAELEATMK